MNSTNFYIVDSVKGGCGKTTIALWKSLELAAAKHSNKKVCYLDLDLLGTSTEVLLGMDHDAGKVYLNDLFCGNRMAVRKKRVKRDLWFEYSNADRKTYTFSLLTESKNKIGVILSDPDQSSKNRFRVGYPTDGHHIDYDFFARRLNELIKELIEGGFTDFVIDMPPNSDPYTDSIFDLLLHQKEQKDKKDKNVSLLLVSSLDYSHITTNYSWYSDLEKKDHSWYTFDSVELYFNDIRRCVDNENHIITQDWKNNYTLEEIVQTAVSHFNKSTVPFKDIKSFFVYYNSSLSAEAINKEGIKKIDLNIVEVNKIDDNRFV